LEDTELKKKGGWGDLRGEKTAPSPFLVKIIFLPAGGSRYTRRASVSVSGTVSGERKAGQYVAFLVQKFEYPYRLGCTNDIRRFAFASRSGSYELVCSTCTHRGFCLGLRPSLSG